MKWKYIADGNIYSWDPVAQQGERHLDRVEVVSSSLSGVILKTFLKCDSLNIKNRIFPFLILIDHIHSNIKDINY